MEHRVLPGATNRPEVWADLEAMVEETWPHASGAEMTVRDWGIDSSGFTAEVYAFVRRQAGRPVHAVDGQDSYAGAFLGVGAKDSTAAGRKLRRGLKTVRIGASFAKQEMMGCLALQRPPEGKPFPAGFVHLPRDVSEDQVKQLTAEELVTHVTRGRTRRGVGADRWAAQRGAGLRELRPRACRDAGLGPLARAALARTRGGARHRAAPAGRGGGGARGRGAHARGPQSAAARRAAQPGQQPADEVGMADTPEQQLAKLRAQLAKLDRAMASGVLTVEQADNAGRITYRGYAEMRQARADLVRRISDLEASVSGAAPRRTRHVVMTGRSGW
ncbi:hypothetical protein Mnod_6670 [Methylobacterium nodulans ORS 2060]|uniref:Terminase large subunit GpA endonuclease domain-containing protein n=1 Tax=Methylobacterium nodulans (strain LMG 21967 / CNCM I-2342 / ORS 2060) TaxID=460265 RepID=B8IET9_METNO|nr:hypothetical protein Mnod_6670 [Methylobacterium nodulans ORS 2060]